MSDEKPTSMRFDYGSKRGALLRIIRDLQRFNEEQLKILISMAHKVRHAKRNLALVAEVAEQMMLNMPTGVRRALDPAESRQIEQAPPEITKH